MITRVSHILRKYDPSEWGGTETAMLRLMQGLQAHGAESTILAPHLDKAITADPLAEAGATMQRFKSFVPVLGISTDRREQLIRWGGNVMSFQLFRQLMDSPSQVIHTHTLNRLAGVGMMAARLKKVPFVASIHGGYLDLPAQVQEQLAEPLKGGIEWGKVLGMIVRSRQVLEKADAVLTCNPREAELLRERYPHQRVIVQPHSVPAAQYSTDQRAAALKAFPIIQNRKVILSVARLDPVKNQRWLVQQLPEIVRRHPEALLVLAGPATSNGYGEEVHADIRALGLEKHVVLTGGLATGSAELIGLYQQADTVVLPSTSETFGLAILEAWAAGTPIISSSTSGAKSLIQDRGNGWVFDLEEPTQFHRALDEALIQNTTTRGIITEGSALVSSTYDVDAVAGRVLHLYHDLLKQKQPRKQPAMARRIAA